MQCMYICSKIKLYKHVIALQQTIFSINLLLIQLFHKELLWTTWVEKIKTLLMEYDSYTGSSVVIMMMILNIMKMDIE